MATIEACVQMAAERLHALDDPKREAQALLCAIADVTPSYLYTWPERELETAVFEQFQAALAKREQGISLAYILGKKEFWNFTLYVQEGVLVPRPETELLLEACLEFTAYRKAGRFLDLGTGTGAIALAFAQERPDWKVIAVDYSDTALAVAEKNREALGLENVKIIKSSWFDAVEGEFDIIASNPPYIDADEPELDGDGVRFEPMEALVAPEQGLADIKQITREAPQYLTPRGPLLIEHGYEQGLAVRQLFEAQGFYAIKTEKDYADLDRFTVGCLSSPKL